MGPLGAEQGVRVDKRRRTQAERREEAEARIIEAAIRLLSQRGYDAFTLADVGDAAGYSRGLPAHYFGRKEDLLAEVVRYVVGSYVRSIEALPVEERGLPRLRDVIRQYVRHSRTDEGKALVIILTQALVQPGLHQQIAELHRQGLRMFEEEIRAGIRAGTIQRTASPATLARMIYAFLRGQMAFSAFDAAFDVPAVVEEFIAALTVRLAPA